jgi:DNA-binding response OmpR family regulator
MPVMRVLLAEDDASLGPDLARQLRQAGPAAPVLILTGPDAAAGRAAGADDVLVKPFEVGELLARLRALQRTPPATAAPGLVLGGLEFDPASRQVLVGGQPVTLTAAELGILEILLRRSPAVVGPRLIARHVRASDAEASGSDLVDAHVAGLRAQLAGSGLQVQTVSGFGYRIIALPDAG